MNSDYLRKKMVEVQLLTRDISNKRVIDAFLKVPRERFALRADMDSAYADYPLPIGCGQTISQPYMVALMTQCLELKGRENVLEIGTGSGYQTAILAEIAAKVYTIERFQELSDRAKRVLTELEYKNIYFKADDGSIGWKEHSPFDAIIVTAAAPSAPNSLLKQLAEDGRLVIPIGSSLSQVLTVYTKNKKKIDVTEVCGCVFVPLVGKEGWKDER